MLSISSPAELETWLGEQYYFEGGRLARVEQSVDGVVTFVLERYLRMGLRPGDVSAVEMYELSVGAPIEFEAPAMRDSGQLVESVDAYDRDGRLVIQIDLGHDRLRLVADEVAVRDVATQHRRTQPWVTDELAVATAAAHDDQFWVRRVSGLLGTAVVWRVLGAHVPRRAGLDPDGCFLQTRSRLATTDYGVFCARSSDGAHTTLARYRNDDVDTALWQSVRLVVADFNRIRCGNCVFESADWLVYLATEQFPPDERLRGTI